MSDSPNGFKAAGSVQVLRLGKLQCLAAAEQLYAIAGQCRLQNLGGMAVFSAAGRRGRPEPQRVPSRSARELCPFRSQ